MGPRSRSLRCAILVFVGLAIAALPGTWPNQIPGSALGPTLTWAGGTPDETLNPPPTPPPASGKKSGSYATGGGETPERLDETRTAVTWITLWRVFRATILRI